MGVALIATTTDIIFAENITEFPSVGPILSEKERIRMEFYQTYDVMTGIRIAATLGGFFTMMVLLVLYKSKCKSRTDESLEAAITAAVADEEELEAVLSQNKYDFIGHGPRQSLGNMSAPTYTRFSSIGGYGGLINPPARRYDRLTKGRISLPASDLSFRHFNSAPTSSINCHEQKSASFWKSYNEEDENDLDEMEENEETNDRKFLQVPNHHQRLQPDRSANSFHVERRSSCSKTEYFRKTNEEDFKCPRSSSHTRPNIQVIQATPQISPSESSSGLLDDQHLASDLPTVNSDCKLAPLASIGSCSAISSIESENRSMGSDSVFINNENMDDDDDTDKDQYEEELSAKSDHDCTNKKYRIIPTTDHSGCFIISGNLQNRRFSDSSMQLCTTSDNSNISLFPIVTNLASHATNQTTTSLYNKSIPDECSSSSTSLSSSFSCSNSTSLDKRKKGTFSRIAVIDVPKRTSSPVKTDKFIKKTKLTLSKSEPKTINTFSEHSVKDLRTLSLRNLMNSKIWCKETLF